MASDGSLTDHERAQLLSEIVRVYVPPERILRFMMDMRVMDRMSWDDVLPPQGRTIGQCKTAMAEMIQLFRQEALQFPSRLETTQTLPGVSSLTAMDPVAGPRHTPSYQYNEPYIGYPPPPAQPPISYGPAPPQHHRTLLPRPSPMSPSSAEQARRPQPSPSSERPEVPAPKRGRPSKATVQARERENEEATRAGREPPWMKSTKRTKSSRPSDERLRMPHSATTPSRDAGESAVMSTTGPGDSPTYTASAGGGKRRRLTEPPEKLAATTVTADTEPVGLSATQSPALTSATQSSEAAPTTTAVSISASMPSTTIPVSTTDAELPLSAPAPVISIPTPSSGPDTAPYPSAPLPSTPAERSAGQPTDGT